MQVICDLDNKEAAYELGQQCQEHYAGQTQH